MTARLEPAPLRITAPISMPMVTIGTNDHAQKTPQVCFDQLFPAQKHAIALARAVTHAAHHHSFCLWSTRKRQRTLRSSRSAKIERP
jgi:hypothetical protein